MSEISLTEEKQCLLEPRYKKSSGDCIKVVLLGSQDWFFSMIV